MHTPFNAPNLRLWAQQCEDQANDARVSGDERARLVKMRDALLVLAENEDWLNGASKARAWLNPRGLGRPPQAANIAERDNGSRRKS